MFSEVKKLIDSVDGWLSEREAQFLYETAKKASKDGVIVEIGSWKGKSTICLAKGSLEGNKVSVYAIDPHTGSSEHQKDGKPVWTFDEFKKNIENAGASDIVTPIVEFSHEAVKEWNKPISFLWIDGAHEYEFVKKDFELWSPFLIDGGIIAFHDVVGGRFTGPRKVILESIFRNKNFSRMHLADSVFSSYKRMDKIFSPHFIKRNHLYIYLYIFYPSIIFLKKIIKSILKLVKRFL